MSVITFCSLLQRLSPLWQALAAGRYGLFDTPLLVCSRQSQRSRIVICEVQPSRLGFEIWRPHVHLMRTSKLEVKRSAVTDL